MSLGHDISGEPTLSVIMCVNRWQIWLDEAIQSVLTQDDSDFEFLIAANACSDDLWVQLQKYAKSDSRIRLFRTSIGQLAFNLNFLADQANGQYLVRMDADDVSEPNRIGILREKLRLDSLDVLGSAVTLIDHSGCEIGRMKFPRTAEQIVKSLPLRTTFCHPSTVIRRQFLFDIRGYLGGFNSEDLDFWLRAKRAGGRMCNLADPLLRYRIHNNQSIALRMGYAEVTGHWLRELLHSPGWFTTQGFTISFVKAICSFFLPGIHKYTKKCSSKNHE